MKKIILSVALVFASQVSLASVQTPSGTVTIFYADKSGAFASITGDLAQSLYDNGRSLEGNPHIKAIDRFVCGNSSVGMKCITVLTEITSMEDSEIAVTSQFDTDKATFVIWIVGADAMKIYNGMEDAFELVPGLKLSTEFVCAKGDKIEKSACYLSFYVNGKKVPALPQMKKVGLNFN
ncbi:hypothetical protein DOM22_02775 [Bdellovibrio sp. ZAP7]|uniref:hypothetical protein n=1 Tax=Bdellovibrio sp. ZAP7 TaxID=2231053 RepID=UPI001157FA0B|nr:hypothetical protein [Bdellovibrio sp. ZAP7]QDK44151.1 hypothetical protein DOM22_02775 [Bdellovibrio sp. ZAP7]